METRLSILFFIKGTKRATDDQVSIYLRVTISGQRFETSTHRYVERSKWSKEAGRLKGHSEEAKRVNTFLDTIRAKVYTYQREIQQNEQPLTAETFKAKWSGIADRPRMLCEVFTEHNGKMAQLVDKDYSPATLERYKTSLDHTRSFLKWKYNIEDIAIDKLNYEFVTEYEFWLKSVRNCNHNTSMKYIANFRKIVNICIKNGWLQRDPFLGFKMTKKEVIRHFLSDTELQDMANRSFATDRLNQVRDIFLFCCFTGLAYADIKKLKRSEISPGLDGEKWIFTERQKTETQSRIPILPIAQSIIDKYCDHPQCVAEDRVLPVLSNQKMNAYLKEIADICGINKVLTFHIARHTFATTVTLSNGVPIESVSKMLGHKNIKITQHYAKILDRKVSDDMILLRQKLSNNLT
ncbi:MAG: site-specific integrase [Sphingobacteriales bacterium]|nr:MAG: site-specific integrase [Sphingobacteriales bacterium]